MAVTFVPIVLVSSGLVGKSLLGHDRITGKESLTKNCKTPKYKAGNVFAVHF
jgi:hypothetical protein